MDAPQATETHDRPPLYLPEAEFSRMVAGALQAHHIEGAIDQLLGRINPGNGRSAIIGPAGNPVRLNVPSAQDLGLTVLQAVRVILQTQRITLVALNDIDSRLRLYMQAQAGKSNDRPDRQDQAVPAEPLAQGGSQSPEAAAQ